MSDSKFLTFNVLSSSGKEEVAINVGLVRYIKHRLGENDGDDSLLDVFFIDEPEPHVFRVTETIAISVILKLRELRL